MEKRENKAVTLIHRTQEKQLCLLLTLAIDRIGVLLCRDEEHTDKDAAEFAACARFVLDFRDQCPELWSTIQPAIAPIASSLVILAEAVREDDERAGLR